MYFCSTCETYICETCDDEKDSKCPKGHSVALEVSRVPCFQNCLPFISEVGPKMDAKKNTMSKN